MISIGSVVLRVDDLDRQASFWEQALDYVRRPGSSDDFLILEPRVGGGPNLSLDRLYSEVHLPPRIHLDLYSDDRSAEVARLRELGATEVQWDRLPPDADYTIMSDPEGNRFCVIDQST